MEQKEYTWSRKNPFTARRLDYILSTHTILSNIHDCLIHSVAQSDHRLVNILYNMSHVQRSKVKGISIPRNHKCFLKLLLYADDITLFLQDRDDKKKKKPFY